MIVLGDEHVGKSELCKLIMAPVERLQPQDNDPNIDPNIVEHRFSVPVTLKEEYSDWNKNVHRFWNAGEMTDRWLSLAVQRHKREKSMSDRDGRRGQRKNIQGQTSQYMTGLYISHTIALLLLSIPCHFLYSFQQFLFN